MSGRKSKFTAGLAEVILQRISDGESLRSVCADPGMPCRRTVGLWAMGLRGADAAFVDQYARARSLRADALFDEITDLADDATNEDVNLRRLQIDSRKFTVARMAPKKYGERSQVDMNVGGQADAPPIKVCTSTDETLRDALETLEESGGLDG